MSDPRAIVRNSERFERACPGLYRAINGKRFLLPHYRQSDYANQEQENLEMVFGLVTMALGFFGYNDDVHHATYANYCGALWTDRPVLFLERELGGPLSESALPTEMAVEDILWPWPQFRVYLPLGLLTIEREGEARSLTYLDLAYVPEEGLGMPPHYAKELEEYLRTGYPNFYRAAGRIPVTELKVQKDKPYLAVSGMLDWSEIGSPIGTSYALIMPWNNKRVGELLKVRNDLHTPLACDDADREFLDRMLRLALNVLLFLSQKPFFYKPEIVRALKLEGKHRRIKPALARAHFVGAERFKRASELAEAHAAKVAASGHHLPAHWRKGHWKRQVHGPRNTLRRWQWISIYHTFGPQEEANRNAT